jgi:mono/diheme cytochrome c family protein
MKKITVIIGFFASVFLIGCKDNRDPGRVYAPDMGYSRAYETYGYNDVDGEYENLRKRGIRYNAMPVPGTMARDDMEAYPYPGTDSGYNQSVAFKNPFDTVTLSKDQMTEAQRLYLVNCAICHGSKLDGNGPLWNGGNGPFPAAPRDLVSDYSKKLADGQMYHVIMFGKGQMGSYASQLHAEQRWWVIKYIRSKQGPAVKEVASASADTTATAKK